MPRLKLSKTTFRVIPEGEHIFRIYAVEYKEEYGKILVKMVNAKGQTHVERFTIQNKEGEFIDGALNAFSFLAKCALNDFERDDIDTDELVDHYIRATIVHKVLPSNKVEGETTVFANITDKHPADGFTETPVERALTLGHEVATEATEETPTEEEKAEDGLDLDALLGDI